MSIKPLVLDLFCGAGGASVGYWRAGFDVAGVDVKPQSNYPYRIFREEVISLLDAARHLGGVQFIHASPPCQGYSTQTADKSKHQRLIEAVRQRLQRIGLPYVIENVEGARKELINPVRYCGSSFGLDVRRHRYFESNLPLVSLPCDHSWQTPRFRSLDASMVKAGRLATVVGVHGHINYPGEFDLRCKAMGIDWMTNSELVEAIPPAYTEHIGRQVIEQLRLKEAI
jgi:DNA (cytosine-5)-methyltransferase 1